MSLKRKPGGNNNNKKKNETLLKYLITCVRKHLRNVVLTSYSEQVYYEYMILISVCRTSGVLFLLIIFCPKTRVKKSKSGGERRVSRSAGSHSRRMHIIMYVYNSFF